MPTYNNVCIEFYNLKGERIDKTTINNQNGIIIDSEKFRCSGVYLYRITADNKSAFGKFTIVK